MYPAIIVAAFFTGVFLNNLFQKAPPVELGKTFLFGFVAVLGLWALEAREMPIVAWALLVVPTVVFASSFLYAALNPPPPPKPKPLPAPLPAPAPKPEEPAVQLPDENTVCVELEFDPSKPKPAPLPSCSVCEDGSLGMPGSCPAEPACPTDALNSLGGNVGGSGRGGFGGGASSSGPTATPNLDDLLKSMNKSLTPVTVCNA